MRDFTMKRLWWMGAGSIASGIVALIAIIFQLSHLAVILAIAAGVLCGAGVWQQARQLHRKLDHTHRMLGAFVRGDFDARIQHIHGLDTIARLQYRLNNTLDIIDLAIREEQAAVHAGDDKAYVAKLTASPLYANACRPAPPILEIPAQLNVEPILSQLSQLKQTAAQLQATSRDLLHRAEQPPAAASDSPKFALSMRKIIDHARGAPVTVKNLQSACEKMNGIGAMIERLAERSEIMALNMAISAAHAGGDERINAAVSSMRLLADQTRESRDQISRIVDETYGTAQAAMRAIYDIATLMHQINEAYALGQRDSGHTAPSGNAARVTYFAEVNQTLAAANQLHAQTLQLDAALNHIGEAA